MQGAVEGGNTQRVPRKGQRVITFKMAGKGLPETQQTAMESGEESSDPEGRKSS